MYIKHININSIPRKSKDQTLPLSSRESFTWIILKTIRWFVLDFQGMYIYTNENWDKRCTHTHNICAQMVLKNHLVASNLIGYPCTSHHRDVPLELNIRVTTTSSSTASSSPIPSSSSSFPSWSLVIILESQLLLHESIDEQTEGLRHMLYPQGSVLSKFKRECALQN